MSCSTICNGIFASILCIFMLFDNASAQKYEEVKIGKQVWMKKNLDASTFRNGDTIYQAKNSSEWRTANQDKIPAFIYYEYDIENGKKYGKLYNWYAVNDTRGLAPKGYHIPKNIEWSELMDHLGGTETAGKKMKTSEGWKNHTEKNGNIITGHGDNSSGFTGLPAGVCAESGTCGLGEIAGGWWAADEHSKRRAFVWMIANTIDKCSKSDEGVEKYTGFSVRCIKD